MFSEVSNRSRSSLLPRAWRRRDALSRLETELLEILGEAKPMSPLLEQHFVRDQRAIDDRLLFMDRFGFDWPHCAREELVALKHQADITDQEIRFLRVTRSLTNTKAGVRLIAGKRNATVGIVVITLFLSLFATLSLTALPAGPISLGTLLGISSFLSGLLVCAWLQYKLSVRPWRIKQRLAAEINLHRT